jgi:primosomal protein N' (replication factor Y)
MSYRDLMMYPPAAHMMAVLVLSNDEMSGEAHISELSDRARAQFADKRPNIIGPAPAGIGKINDVYRYIFYIKHRDYHVLVDIKDYLENYIDTMKWGSDSVQFDFNPMSNY